jgi:hypothetical protein
MAGNKRPSFLKRQKELQRVAKASQKREERRLRKRSPGGEMGDLNDLGVDLAPNEDGDDMAGPEEPADEGDSAERV